MSEEHIQQVGEIILLDGDIVCDVVSDLHSDENGGMHFMTHNPITGQRYNITISCEEI